MTGAAVYGIWLRGRRGRRGLGDRGLARRLTAGALLALLATAACGGKQPGSRAPAATPAAPDWVAGGGVTPRLPHARFATGYARAAEAEGLEATRRRAAADLASQLELRIEHELRDVSEERDGHYAYEIAAITRSTVDLELRGLRYESWTGAGTIHALAILERASGAARRREALQRAQVELEACMAQARTLEDRGRSVAAARHLHACRRPLAAGLEHAAVASALVGSTSQDQARHRALVAAAREIDARTARLLARPAGSPGEAADLLALQLVEQGVDPAGRLSISAFRFGTADLSGPFGRQMGVELEVALARHAARSDREGTTPELRLRGVYVESASDVRLNVVVRERESARLVASAATSLPKQAIPSSLPLRPPNFDVALRSQRVLADGLETGSELRLELWTTRGRRDLVYVEGETYDVYLRVNRPAWVQLVYVLQSGEHVPLDAGFRISAARVGEPVRYPRRFQVIAPFGVEHFHATAFRERPPALPTRSQRIAGEAYEIVDGGLAHLERERSRRRGRGVEVAEAFVAVTTTPRGAPWP